MSAAISASPLARLAWRPLPLALLLALATGGCVLAPTPTVEELTEQLTARAPLPVEWQAGGGLSGSVEDNWLASFGDAGLEQLVAEAMAYNADLRAAAARVERAAAIVRIASSEFYPSVNLIASESIENTGDSSGLDGWIVNASWEADVWGRVRYGARAERAQYASTAADFEYARQSLAALVAKSWFLATETYLQEALIAEMYEASLSLLTLAEQRYNVGVGGELDVASARVTTLAYRDSLRQVQLAETQALRALEILLGRYPAADISVPNQFGGLAAGVPTGLPSELLERRPDIIAAQNRVAAAFDLVQQAQAARLPRLSLTGGGSSLSSDLFVLEDRDNPVWSLGAQLLAPIFAGGELKANVAIRTAEQEQALAEFVQTTLSAFDDVESALSTELALQDREEILASAVVDAERAVELAETRYRVGSGDLRAVEQEQLDYHAVRMSLLRVQSERRLQRVNLHLALGGNFESTT